ncbi:MAG: hypothetical protein RL557_153 [archaeon]|jgi:hypothetical protein
MIELEGLVKTLMECSLREAFSDTLDQGVSRAGIVVLYKDDSTIRAEIGIPYTISAGNLVMGPHLKNMHTSPPKDYDSRKVLIPIDSIGSFQRIELDLSSE